MSKMQRERESNKLVQFVQIESDALESIKFDIGQEQLRVLYAPKLSASKRVPNMRQLVKPHTASHLRGMLKTLSNQYTFELEERETNVLINTKVWSKRKPSKRENQKSLLNESPLTYELWKREPIIITYFASITFLVRKT